MQYKFHVHKPPEQRHLTHFLFSPHQSSIYIAALCAKAPELPSVHLDTNTQCADTHRCRICVAHKQNGRNKLFGRHTNRQKDNINIDLTEAGVMRVCKTII